MELSSESEYEKAAKIAESASGKVQGKRDRQEDDFFASDKRGIYMVADGVGSNGDGDIASRLIAEEFENNKGNFPLRDILSRANNQITSYNDREGALAASTVAALQIHEKDDGSKVGEIVWAGDSRVYLLKYGSKELQQLTRDHQQPIILGGAITKFLGGGLPGGLDVESLSVEVDTGDIFLLATDGLEAARVSESGLVTALGQLTKYDDITIDEVADDILTSNMVKNGPDNTAIVIVKVS